MIEDVIVRDVNTRYGSFHFELVEYPGPAPLVDIYFDGKHLGYCDYINLNEATEYDLLALAAGDIKYPAED